MTNNDGLTHATYDDIEGFFCSLEDSSGMSEVARALWDRTPKWELASVLEDAVDSPWLTYNDDGLLTRLVEDADGCIWCSTWEQSYWRHEHVYDSFEEAYERYHNGTNPIYTLRSAD